MDENKIRQLLDKYWEGETSLEEEQELKSYFASSQVADEFAPFTPLFLFFEEEKHIKMESPVAHPPVEKKGGNVVHIKWLINIAASVAVIIAMVFLVRNFSPEQPDQFAFDDTYESPEEAYAEVKKALLYVSAKMNKGVSTAAQTLEKMEPLDEIIRQ